MNRIQKSLWPPWSQTNTQQQGCWVLTKHVSQCWLGHLPADSNSKPHHDPDVRMTINRLQQLTPTWTLTINKHPTVGFLGCQGHLPACRAHGRPVLAAAGGGGTAAPTWARQQALLAALLGCEHRLQALLAGALAGGPVDGSCAEGQLSYLWNDDRHATGLWPLPQPQPRPWP